MSDFRNQVVSSTRALSVELQSQNIPGGRATREIKEASDHFALAYDAWITWLNSDHPINVGMLSLIKQGLDSFMAGYDTLINKANPFYTN